ncbi:uncharacterized protein LOC142635330 [Castanea sativa]|uniref:uncharacterized protein LOC142635330 n=1 Tax=Castanea sativa TaxID=21020 RepID=UPI003F64FCCE
MEADILRYPEQGSHPKKARMGEKKDRYNKKTSSSGRSQQYTPLNMPLEQVFMQIKNDPSLKWRVLVDNGSSVEILYYPAFQQMRLGRDQLRLVHLPLVRFGGMKVQPVGTITLPVVVEVYPPQIEKEVNFHVVDCLSSYNTIIGTPTLNSWKTVTSTYHLSVKFPTDHGVGQVQEDQLAARECYLAMLAMDKHMQTMSIDEKRITTESIEVLEDIPLEEGNLEKYTKVGASMGEKTKQDLVQFLKKSIDVFAWSHEDMPGIDLSVITHRINVYPSSKPIRQKKRVFAPEQDNAIKEEV